MRLVPEAFRGAVDQVAAVHVHDLAGDVAGFVRGQEGDDVADIPRPVASYTVHWDGRDASGRDLASGVYLYRLWAGRQVETRTLVLLR